MIDDCLEVENKWYEDCSRLDMRREKAAEQ